MAKLTQISDQSSYERGKVIGKGAYGIVYLGFFKGRKVAVKKIDLDMLDTKDTEVERQLVLDHVNVLKILTVESDDFFRYKFLSYFECSISLLILLF